MKPLEVNGEIEHFTAYDEYESLKKNTDRLKSSYINIFTKSYKF